MVPPGLNCSVAGISEESVLWGRKFDDEVGMVLAVSEAVADDDYFSNCNSAGDLFPRNPPKNKRKSIMDVENVAMMEDLDRLQDHDNNQ